MPFGAQKFGLDNVDTCFAAPVRDTSSPGAGLYDVPRPRFGRE